MSYPIDYKVSPVPGGVTGIANGMGLVALNDVPDEMTQEERDAVIAAGSDFADKICGSDPCLVITGQFTPLVRTSRMAENQVMRACMAAFGYPDGKKARINVVLDSPGGSLDSAYKIVRYLTAYASELNVHVPRRAKSASTLLALGAKRIYLSRFGELGPLDTQIFDPRNPVAYVSALDCYQSVDYVRLFGVNTMSKALRQLSVDAGGQIPLQDLLGTASAFAAGSVGPMLTGIRALDFGAWGRSLKIGERYAQILMEDNHAKDEAAAIAERLVYSYTHHLFPIDYREACEMGLPAEPMSEASYRLSLDVVEKCKNKSFIGFVSQDELARTREQEQSTNEAGAEGDAHRQAGAGDQGAEGALGHEHAAVAKVPDHPDDYRRS
jgi:Serine dehydrogenase proteinase